MVRSYNFLKQKLALLFDKAFISNKWVDSKTKKKFQVTNPVNSQIISSVPDMAKEDFEKATEAAYIAYQTWKETTAKERSRYLRKLYNLIIKNHENLSAIITLEAGKPIIESQAEIRYGSSFVEFFSEEARRIKGEIIQSPNRQKKLLVEKQPIGVISLITPWNFPFAMIVRKMAAALAAGCTCVIKPAEDTPFSALALMKLVEEAEIPKGVVNVVTCCKKNASIFGNIVCQSSLVAGISFTGSTNVGKLLYQQCSCGIKRIGLELGGNAPFIVYESADIQKAIGAAIMSKFRCNGQTCIASNRFFIHCSKYELFVEKLIEEVQNLRMGDVNDPCVNCGPLINQSQFEKVSSLVEDAVSNGAKILIGGKAAPEFGPLYYQPTVLADVTSDMRIYKEEVFGPVVNLCKFESEEESIKMANDTQTGLAGYIFSEDVAQIFRVSKKLEVGMCGVNEGSIAMAEVPFGGIKESGIGREGSRYGVDEFTYVKYICIGGL